VPSSTCGPADVALHWPVLTATSCTWWVELLGFAFSVLSFTPLVVLQNSLRQKMEALPCPVEVGTQGTAKK
jgi:hypothetical protein